MGFSRGQKIQLSDTMDYDRGRVYQCTKCYFVGEKRAAIKHYPCKHFGEKEHILSCDQLCHFSSDNKQLMKRHPSFYAPHNNARLFTTEKGIYRGSDEVYVKVNSNPQQVDPDLHLSKWEQEASLLFWITKKKPKPSAAAGSAQQLIPSVDLPVLKSALASYFGSIPMSNPSPLDCPSIAVTNEIQPLDHEVAETEVSTEFLDTTVVVAEKSDLADQILHLSDPPAMPSPLKCPESSVPRPSLPNFVLLPPSEVEENLMPQLRKKDSKGLQKIGDVFKQINKVTDESSEIKSEVEQALEYIIKKVCNETNDSNHGTVDNVNNQSTIEKVSTPTALSETSTASVSVCESPVDTVKVDQRKFSSQKYEHKYTWLYCSHSKNGFMCKICDLFALSSSSTRTFVFKGVILGTHPTRQLESHAEICNETNDSNHGTVDNVNNQSTIEKVSTPTALSETSTASVSVCESPVDTVKVDQGKFSSQKYEHKYTWLYCSHSKNGFMCKICDLFALSSSSTRTFVFKGVILGTHPTRQLESHAESVCHLSFVETYSFSKSNVNVSRLLRVQDAKAKDQNRSVVKNFFSVLTF
ncbi:unnamed protein product [Mytilus edulis]|uniref:Uncharacterized protein n=1 Tax=Mytilus edulis TaxID=6550 RepID=A0A8S3T5W5_MYTED|nr:unnamed protein product [Mytilus edulis]